MAEVLVSLNTNAATENAKFRFEYQIVGGARGNFDWGPTFGNNNAQLITSLYVVVKTVIFTRHQLRVSDDEIVLMGLPYSTKT